MKSSDILQSLQHKITKQLLVSVVEAFIYTVESDGVIVTQL